MEAEKIRQLEARMKLFEGGDAAEPVAAANGNGVESGSDSSSDSDSSGSDSE